ncbi:DUF6366 family protein [Listeria grandensis]|nr:DUF6366 family protein [Listeria grandensis]
MRSNETPQGSLSELSRGMGWKGAGIVLLILIVTIVVLACL